MKTIRNAIFLLIVSLLISFCQSQTKKGEQQPKSVSSEKVEGDNPRIVTRVNKQYDAKGRLIRFDSAYSYRYTSKGFDSTKVVLDSVLKGFRSFYNERLMTGFYKHFDDIFLTDSLFKYDFLNEDYFRKRYELNMKRMDEMFHEMDSLKMDFLKTSQPSQLEKPKNKTRN